MKSIQSDVVEPLVSPPPASYAVGHERAHALLVCEAEVEDLQRYPGTLPSRSGWAPDKALLVPDSSWVGFLVFGCMGNLKAAHCHHSEGRKLVKRTECVDAADVLIQGRDALTPNQAARSRYCTFADAFYGGTDPVRDVLAVCSIAFVVHRFRNIVNVKLGYGSLQICCLPNNGDSNAPICDGRWRDCDVLIDGVWPRAR